MSDTQMVDVRPNAQPQDWPPPWDEIDKGIEPLVRKLVSEGYTTLSSCEGHKGANPWVALAIPRKENAEAFVENLSFWLQAEGLDGCYVSIRSSVNKSYIGDTFVVIEWWAPDIVSKWASNAGSTKGAE